MRVVADTNTVVSPLLWRGPPAEVLQAAREARILLFASATLIAELEDALGRAKFKARLARVGSSPSELLTNYRTLIALVRAPPIAPTSRDPDDDHVLACALGASADLIVSRDRDLCELGEFCGIRILPARAALATYPRGRRAASHKRRGYFAQITSDEASNHPRCRPLTSRTGNSWHN